MSQSWELDKSPVQGGSHYPRNLDELMAWFPDDRAATEYSAADRGATAHRGLFCPHCGVKVAETTLSERRRWWCRECRRWFSVTSGTAMERSKVSLRNWLMLAW
jgi:hypothetical protein